MLKHLFILLFLLLGGCSGDHDLLSTEQKDFREIDGVHPETQTVIPEPMLGWMFGIVGVGLFVASRKNL